LLWSWGQTSKNRRLPPAPEASAPSTGAGGRLSSLLRQKITFPCDQVQVSTFWGGSKSGCRRADIKYSVFGTHCFRAAGMNRLGELNAGPVIISAHGHWASDAWADYGRRNQLVLMKMGEQNGWCPFGLRLQISVSTLRWRPTTAPHCDSDAHVIIDRTSRRPIRRGDAASKLFLVPGYTGSRCGDTCMTFQHVYYQVPLDNETSLRNWDDPTFSVSCTLSRAPSVPELRSATLALTPLSIAETKAWVSGTV
jgi:hypothetical protein